MKSNHSAELAHRLSVEIVRVGGVLERAAGRLFRSWRVSAAQFNALHLIAASHGGVRATEITRLLVVDPSSTTYLLDQLQARGWISRKPDPDDRRALRVVLTAKGKTTHHQLAAAYRATLEHIAKAHSSGDLEAAAGLLSAFAQVAESAVDSVTVASLRK